MKSLFWKRSRRRQLEGETLFAGVSRAPNGAKSCRPKAALLVATKAAESINAHRRSPAIGAEHEKRKFVTKQWPRAERRALSAARWAERE